MSKNNDVFAMSISALEKEVHALLAALDAGEKKLGGLVELTTEERKTSHGKFRNGEADALLSVLDAAERQPALFASLADKDFGADPHAFEIGVLRDRLQRAAELAPVAEKLEEFSALVSDTMLRLAAETKPVMLQAYGIAKSIARTDDPLRAAIAPAIDFYASIARRGAATRARHRQPPPPPPGPLNN